MQTADSKQPTTFSFSSDDGLDIVCYRWPAIGEPLATVQIVHGMGEHALRYSRVAKTLAASGFDVVADDHRGHGRSISGLIQRGDFGKGGFDLLVRDVARLGEMVDTESSGVPRIILGHSMGSFVGQRLAIDTGRSLGGLVLTGTGALDGLAEVVMHGGADLGETLNARIRPLRTPHDWLSRDRHAVDAFASDPLCFPRLSDAAARSVAAAAGGLADPRQLRSVPAGLPILIQVGSEDPIGQYLDGVRILVERYRSAGLSDVTWLSYEGARHEVLNEIDSARVLEDLRRWLLRLPAVHSRLPPGSRLASGAC